MQYFDIYLENEKDQKESDSISFDGKVYRVVGTRCTATWKTFEEALNHLKNVWSALGFGVVSVIAR